MIPQWVESYNKDYIEFLSALKLDSNEEEVQRYEKVAILALTEIFAREKFEVLLNTLAFEKTKQAEAENTDEYENEDSSSDTEKLEFPKCVPINKMNIEYAIFWSNFASYLFHNDINSLDAILPELSTFCEYLARLIDFLNYKIKIN